MAAAARAHGFTAITATDSLPEAVAIARDTATPGHAVLLSPGTHSWNIDPDYLQRGALFKHLVHQLPSVRDEEGPARGLGRPLQPAPDPRNCKTGDGLR
jgi:hypothetical protein